jgi:hypothetical protein
VAVLVVLVSTHATFKGLIRHLDSLPNLLSEPQLRHLRTLRHWRVALEYLFQLHTLKQFEARQDKLKFDAGRQLTPVATT